MLRSNSSVEEVIGVRVKFRCDLREELELKFREVGYKRRLKAVLG